MIGLPGRVSLKAKIANNFWQLVFRNLAQQYIYFGVERDLITALCSGGVVFFCGIVPVTRYSTVAPSASAI
jgi:hypothetical protein